MDLSYSSPDTARLNAMTRAQSKIYSSLLAFLGSDDISPVVEASLKQIMDQFGCSRIGMFEYDHDTRTRRCTCTVSNGQAPESADMTPWPIDATPWLSGRMLARLPVIVNTVDDLPQQATAEKQMLTACNIRSMIAAPLVGVDQIWGYIAMDSDSVRQWTGEQAHLFTSIVGVIGISLQFHASEQKMRRDQQYIRNLYKYMPAGYLRMAVTWDADGKPVDYTYLDANPAASRLLEVRIDDYLGYKASEKGFISDGQLDRLVRSMGSEKELTANIHLHVLDKYCYTVVFIPAPGEVAFLFTDVTESVKTQMRLERNESQLRNIYKNLPVGIELYDTEGYLVDMNDKECEIFGLNSIDDALGVNLFDNPNIPDDVKEKLRARQQVEFVLNYDFSIVGDYYDTNWNKKINLVTLATPLFDSHGKFINYLFINIDNTDISTAHQSIEAFQEMTSLIGEFAQVGYANFDLYTRLGTALDSWYHNFGEKPGIPLDQVVGVLTNVNPEDKPPIKAFFGQVKRGEAKHLRHDVRVTHPDGSEHWIRINLMVRNYNPEQRQIGMVCVNYDITALKQTEQNLIEARDKAETSDKLKSAFLANMSHEIRTPLNAIVGFSSIIAETDEAEQRRSYLSIVQENNDVLLNLISDILDISKIEAGTMEFTTAPVDVRQLCREIINTFSLKVPDGAVELRFDDHSPQVFVQGDKNRITQVISNFLTNAFKFTKEGSITLSYELIPEGQVRFSVTDTGRGIAAEKQGEVFTRFVKLDSFAQGTGLGLSICQSLVERMDGQIGLESEEGRGSRFWFTHPYSGAQPAAETAVEDKSAGMPVKKRSLESPMPLVLVAEDIDSNFLLIETLLKKDYRLLRAHSGEQAVELYKARRPGLILMDMKMPGMDGIEATTLIRKMDTAVPIVALTAFAYDSDREMALEAGCNDFLTKPIAAPALRLMVAKWTAV